MGWRGTGKEIFSALSQMEDSGGRMTRSMGVRYDVSWTAARRCSVAARFLRNSLLGRIWLTPLLG